MIDDRWSERHEKTYDSPWFSYDLFLIVFYCTANFCLHTILNGSLFKKMDENPKDRVNVMRMRSRMLHS